MKLHASKASTTSRPVYLFIAESGIPCELVDVDIMNGEHLQEPFTRLNPSKQVPVLDDDGFVLTESSAILKYLAEKTGSPAYPKELQQRARVNEAMDWLNTGFYREYGYHLIYPQIFPHHVRAPEEANQVTVQWGQAQSASWLGVFEQQFLGKGTRYLCGDEITLADYFGSGIVSVGELIGVSFGKYPKVQAWLDNLRALPSWGSVYDVFDGFRESMKDKPFVTIR